MNSNDKQLKYPISSWVIVHFIVASTIVFTTYMYEVINAPIMAAFMVLVIGINLSALYCSFVKDRIGKWPEHEVYIRFLIGGITGFIMTMIINIYGNVDAIDCFLSFGLHTCFTYAFGVFVTRASYGAAHESDGCL